VAGNTNLKIIAVGLALVVLLGTPSLLPAKEEGQSDSKELRAHLIKALKLTADKDRTFMAVEEKYDRIRQEALERIKKSEEQLEKILSGEKTEVENLTKVITAITSDQDILVNTYKARRDETMALLSPVQQGEYLLITWKWQQKLMGKFGKDKTGQQDEKKKGAAP
jgi:hypothetical protein